MAVTYRNGIGKQVIISETHSPFSLFLFYSPFGQEEEVVVVKVVLVCRGQRTAMASAMLNKQSLP